MLRKTFDTIHNSFSSLEVTEWVPVPNHPTHPPLDYQELLGLEKMGEQTYPIGKLGIRVNIRQLLDGYETREARQQHRRDELGKEGQFEEDLVGRPIRDIVVNVNQNQGDNQPMTDITNNNQGANIGNFANEVKDNARQQANQHNHPAAKQDLAEAVRELKDIFAALDQSYDKTTPGGNAMITAKAVEAIESKPTLKKRLLNAAEEGGIAAIESAVDHPAVKPVVAAFKGFTDA